MNESTPPPGQPERPLSVGANVPQQSKVAPGGRWSHALSGAVGGAIVAVVFGLLIATGTIESGDKNTVVRTTLGNGSLSSSDLPSVNQIYEEDGPGVVFISAVISQPVESPFGAPQEQQGNATGAGFVIDKDGYIMTNAHVVAGAKRVTVRFSDDSSTEAKVVGQDLSTDIALLQVKVAKGLLHPLELGESKGVEVGSPVVAIGNPFGLDRTVTTGIVSALQRSLNAPNNFKIENVIQTDAAINPGNSGGPLLDAEGRVIGINSQIATGGGSGGSVGIGFAVPIDTAKRILPELKKNGSVERGFLGVSTLTLTKMIADELNLKFDSGALVQFVIPNGPADKAGIRGGTAETTVNGEPIRLGGDLIVEIDGVNIADNSQVVQEIEKRKSGERIPITIIRRGKRETIRVKLGKRPDNAVGADLPGQRPRR